MSQTDPTQQECNRYARAWMEKNDMTRSWRAAFPESKAKDKSANERASVFHKHIKIQSRIDQLEQASKKQSEEEFLVSVSDLKKMLVTCYKKGVTDKKDKDGNKTPVNLTASVSAITELNKMDGNHATKKIDLTNSDGSLMPDNWNEFYD